MQNQDSLTMAQPWNPTAVTMAQCESATIPRYVLCHFPHKIDTLNLKRETSASPTTLLSSSSIISHPHLPSTGRHWVSWRRKRKATGSSTEEEDEGNNGDDDYREDEQEQEQDFDHQENAQDPYPRHRGGRHVYSDEDLHPSGTNTHQQRRHSTSVSDSSTLTDSQVGASQSHSGSSQSSSNTGKKYKRVPVPGRQSGRFGYSSGKQNHRNQQPTPPNLPDGSLDERSHSGSDQRRLDKASARNSNNMPGGKKRPASTRHGAGTPIGRRNQKRRTSKHKQQHPDDDASVSSYGSSGSQGSQGSQTSSPPAQARTSGGGKKQSGGKKQFTSPSSKEIAGMNKSQLKRKLEEMRAELNKRPVPVAKVSAKDAEADDDDSDGEVTRSGTTLKYIGDPSNHQSAMWKEINGIVSDEIYRTIKFLNHKKQLKKFALKVLGFLGMKALTLTGNPKKDKRKYCFGVSLLLDPPVYLTNLVPNISRFMSSLP